MNGFARFLHYTSIVLTLIIGLSWVMFAVDEISDASSSQTKKVEENGNRMPQTTGTTTQAPAKDDRGVVRKKIDSAASKLTSPFDGIVADDANVWAIRTVPALLGLLLYGVGLAVLSRWIVTRV